MQPRRDHDAHVPGEVLRQRLLGLGAHDRIEFLVIVVARGEARTFERLGLELIATRRLVRETEAVQADAPLERLAAEGALLRLLEVERRIFLELRVDDVLKLHRRQLKDVVRGDLLRCDLQLLLR